ncbi:MAG TPA: hypothetical protein VNO70_03230 [Blastocatellia bacterium]|nr:hypothetical protein [Blastocatellia bacterium]
METVLIQRRSSLLYALAYKNILVVLTVIYLAIGVALSAAAVLIFDRLLIGAALFALVLAINGVLWAIYLGLLRVFEREARQAVEIGEQGIRETHDGREHAFIPWAGVKEIELDAAILAGASLRVKGNFSEIAVSNVDLEVTRPMSIIEMHRALGRTERMRELLTRLRAEAPQADLKMNRIARRRSQKQAFVSSQPRVGANGHE